MDSPRAVGPWVDFLMERQHFRLEPTSTIKARMNEPINDESLINTGLLVLQHNYCNNRCMMHVLAAELKSAQ